MASCTVTSVTLGVVVRLTSALFGTFSVETSTGAFSSSMDSFFYGRC